MPGTSLKSFSKRHFACVRICERLRPFSQFGSDITFGTAPRESMELMTASPGVLYDVNGMFKDGPVKGKILPGFNLDTRKPLSENLKSTTAALYSPKLPSKVSEAVKRDEARVAPFC